MLQIRARQPLTRRGPAVLVAAAIVFGAIARARVAAASIPVAGPDIDRAVIAELEARGVGQVAIMLHTDLTTAFATASPWTLVIAQQNAPPPELSVVEEHGPIAICLVRDLTSDCSEKLYENVRTDARGFHTPFYLRENRVVHAARGAGRPMLLLQACGARGGNGSCAIATALYGYDRHSDQFYKAFGNVTGSNNNQATRFVETGPLLGAVIVDTPTDNAPYGYWIEVYRTGRSQRYDRVLRYRSKTRYADGNRLAVIDSEMPDILHRLGLGRPGDALPVPPNRSEGCRQPVMRDPEAGCR